MVHAMKGGEKQGSSKKNEAHTESKKDASDSKTNYVCVKCKNKMKYKPVDDITSSLFVEHKTVFRATKKNATTKRKENATLSQNALLYHFLPVSLIKPSPKKEGGIPIHWWQGPTSLQQKI